ncbi:MAG: OmpA family protein [Candidatus Omnitrophota bacterium]
MAISKRSHRREAVLPSAAEFDMEDIWPVFSDIAISLVFFLAFTLLAQFLELSQVFDALERKRLQQTLWEKLRQDEFFQPSIRNGSITMTIQGSLQRFRFAADIVFVAGESSLQPRGATVLTEFARFLSREAPPDLYIEVEGHTDRVPVVSGRYKDNWELSSQRALTVIRLFQSLDDDPSSGVRLNMDRISAIGYGEFRPLEERKESAINRRVEIRLDYSGAAAGRRIEDASPPIK